MCPLTLLLLLTGILILKVIPQVLLCTPLDRWALPCTLLQVHSFLLLSIISFSGSSPTAVGTPMGQPVAAPSQGPGMLGSIASSAVGSMAGVMAADTVMGWFKVAVVMMISDQ